ncbi:GTP-binding protein 2 [Portunus trituberculatus]|uniref:GTP-binding protein 2 n=1 Tax=Portunus trituberculatus TaxID=210409 RepID=A0A5B7D287_PORTR|nr:GTP-binding protein 2 [Portunus trituberculatus]
MWTLRYVHECFLGAWWCEEACKDKMDAFLSLFDPTLEDETASDMDELNGNVIRDNTWQHERRGTLGGIRRGPSVAILPDQLPSEPQEGNIEYKLKLMQWRLREGLGEAIYEIGVEDSGFLLGLTEEELEASMATLRRMACQLGASLTVIREKVIQGHDGQTRKAAEVLVRKVPDDQYSIELRVAVLGNSDVGKSTLLGVLTRGELDNGRGCARLNVFRHRHEVCSGKTSSISLQLMGFDSQGNVIDQTCTRSRDYDDEDICSQSIKIINFIDLAGDQKYLKTTVFGLSGYSPHYAVLVVRNFVTLHKTHNSSSPPSQCSVISRLTAHFPLPVYCHLQTDNSSPLPSLCSAFSGVAPMTEEHLSLARALDVPIVIVVTKTDIASPQQIQRTITDLTQTLTQPGYKREPAEFQIDEVFHVDNSIIVGGLLTKGVITQGTTLLLGMCHLVSLIPCH